MRKQYFYIVRLWSTCLSPRWDIKKSANNAKSYSHYELTVHGQVAVNITLLILTWSVLQLFQCFTIRCLCLLQAEYIEGVAKQELRKRGWYCARIVLYKSHLICGTAFHLVTFSQEIHSNTHNTHNTHFQDHKLVWMTILSPAGS